MNLSSLGSFSSLATNALDTARSTFKGLAEAAVDTDAVKTPAQRTPGQAAQSQAAQSQAAPAEEMTPVAAAVTKAESNAEATEAKPKNSRFGTILDAYA